MRLGKLSADRVLEEFDSDFHGDDGAAADVPANERAKFGSFAFLLFTKQISGYRGGVVYVGREERVVSVKD